VAYRVQLELPRVVQIGRAASLTLPVVSDAGGAQTASSGTLTLTIGGTTVLDAVAITVGPPASYSLLAATTESLAPSESYTETWTLAGVDRFTHTGYLCRKAYFSHVTDATLQDIHPELLDLLPPGEVTAEKPRTAASKWLQRKLLNKGRRPWLVWDEWALVEPEQWYALGLWASDAALRVSGAAASEYKAKALEYRDRADREFEAVVFRYDADETGSIDPEQVTTAAPAVLMVSAGRPNAWRSAWR
jgi:hypothetical protein